LDPDTAFDALGAVAVVIAVIAFVVALGRASATRGGRVFSVYITEY
jgi:hypothetical protein